MLLRPGILVSVLKLIKQAPDGSPLATEEGIRGEELVGQILGLFKHTQGALDVVLALANSLRRPLYIINLDVLQDLYELAEKHTISERICE